jgi:rubrerythrin
MIDCVNLKARRLQREKTREVVKIFAEQLVFKQRQIDSLERIMGELRVRYGLLDYKAQAKEATKSYLKLVSEGASREKVRMVDSLMRNLEQKGGSLVAISDQLQSLQNAYNDIKTEYDRSISDMRKDLTYSNVVARPLVADAKSYPVRSLITLTCAFSALLLALIALVIIDRRPFSNAEPDSH